MIPFPDKQYDIIYADPAWQYGAKWQRISWDGLPARKNIEDHYPTMSMNNLKALTVPDIAKPDCLLFLWVCSPLLTRCIDVGEAWGFTYSTIGFIWHKDAHPVLGCYTHSQCEICLIFKRGKIPQPRGSRKELQFLSCKRGAHSVKPLEVKHRITEMFPTQAKIELFARPLPMFKSLDDEWDYWGNEV